jgi:hypothetical protein
MATQLLIYESVVPLTLARHRDCAVEISGDYGFSRKVNSVPLMAAEFRDAASEYAIVFTGADDKIMPVAILGMRGKENVYVLKDATWHAKYIPAFVRRYPFVFSISPDEQRFLLCVDEAFTGFNREGRGQRIYGDDGKPTQYIDNMLKFLQDYQRHFHLTQGFCQKLNELGLFEPMQAQAELASGEKLSLSGFMAVNRAKLRAVPGDKLAELAKTDELELLYLHLHSMRNFRGLKDRLVEEAASENDGDRNDKRAPADAGKAGRKRAAAGK